jgi:short-subunit dehydrogenase
MKIVVIGATSAIAEQCCRLWLSSEPAELALIARDLPKAEKIAADLRVRSPASSITVQTCDFVDAAAIGSTAASLAAGGPIDVVLIAHGWLADQQACQEDLGLARRALEVNALSPILFAEAFAKHLAKAGRGTIALIGSVAGDRPRRINYTYGAAKSFVAHYAEGMAHRFASTGVGVVVIKPGPTDTPMTAQLKAEGRRLASAASVARRSVSAIRRQSPVVYAPAIWQPIMLIIRHLPRFIFNRLPI